MSKNIAIQEGGVARNFGNVSKLQTSVMGGGSCYWVPEDEVQVKTKHISKNGTYKAADDEVYGYSEVTVNVSGGSGSANSGGVPTTEGGTLPGGIGSAIIGKDPETGNDVGVGVDEDGNIVTTPIPSYIRVTKPPDQTEYHAGDTINPTGIIVHSYLADGTDFGTVLNSELVYPEPVAPEPSAPSASPPDGLHVIVPTPIPYSTTGHIQATAPVNVACQGCVTTLYQLGRYSGGVVIASSNNSAQASVQTVGESYTVHTNQSFTFSGKTVWYGYLNISGSDRPGVWNLEQSAPVCAKDYSSAAFDSANIAPVAWTMIYGQGGAEGAGGNASIPVQWKSPYDGREFEDTFEITVTGTDPDDGGDDGGGGAGHGF